MKNVIIEDKKKKSIEERMCTAERLIEKMKNWMEVVHGADIDKDGKIGYIKLHTMVIAFLGGLLVSVSLVMSKTIDNQSQGTGTYTLIQSGDGTGDITLTVDAISATDGAGNVATGVTSTVTEVLTGTEAAFQSTITLTAMPVSISGNSASPTNGFGGTKIYDMPEGRILVHGATWSGSMLIATNFVPAESGAHMAFGTVVATASTGTIYLTSTQVDIIPNINVDPYTNSVVQFSSALATGAQFDGTATAKDIYANVMINEDDIATNATAYVSGTLKITWSNLGDY